MPWTFNELRICFIVGEKDYVIFTKLVKKLRNESAIKALVSSSKKTQEKKIKKHKRQGKGNYEYPIIISSSNSKYPAISNFTVSEHAIITDNLQDLQKVWIIIWAGCFALKSTSHTKSLLSFSLF